MDEGPDEGDAILGRIERAVHEVDLVLWRIDASVVHLQWAVSRSLDETAALMEISSGLAWTEAASVGDELGVAPRRLMDLHLRLGEMARRAEPTQAVRLLTAVLAGWMVAVDGELVVTPAGRVVAVAFLAEDLVS